MISRKEILDNAVHDCYKEMYAKAQPSADWDKILQEYKDGTRSKDERVYEQHYLSQEEFSYIVNKYIDAYNIQSHWRDNIELLEKYLNKGGSKDKYIDPVYNDVGDMVSPGYRGYEDVDPIKNQILKEVSKIICDDPLANSLTDNIVNIVMNTINECKNFYKFDREESSFRMSTALGASPSSNANEVRQYWKDKTGEDIVIEERNPKLFWYRDRGYTDEELAEEFDDPNWKDNLDKEWRYEQEKKAQKLNSRLKRINN